MPPMALLPRHIQQTQISLHSFNGPRPCPALFSQTRISNRRALLVIAAGLQRPLTGAERKAKRAESQRLGKDIVLIQLGQKGMTPSFLEGVAAALAANELVKIRVAGDEDIKDVAVALEAECDCCVVHKIGFVLTLYRDSSLRPPAGLLGAPTEEERAEEDRLKEESGGRGKKGKKKKRVVVVDPSLPPPPPEFTIL